MIVPSDLLPSEALLPVRPAYGKGSLADLMPSVSAVLGVPGAADVLALTAQLEGIDRVAVLLVDGLGAYQLPVAVPHAPVLADLAAGAATLTAAFPSTTPVSLVTLGTGALPGAHGVLGFTTRKPDGGVLVHILWGDDPDPRQWQPLPTRLETAEAAGVRVTQVTRPEFEGTGLTVSAQRGGRFRGAPDPVALAGQMLAALEEGPGLVYGYHPDLDKAGHEHGVDSAQWREAAHAVDLLLDRLVHGMPRGTALIVTADHGQFNAPVAQRFDLSEDPRLSAGLVTVAGEPRVRYLHVEQGALDDVRAVWRGVLGERVRVLTRDEAIDEGLYGPVPAEHRGRIGDLVVICQDRNVVLASGWEPPIIAQMVAFHGGLTAAEMTVPLLIAR
jgi:hypothetical protein